MPVLDDQTRTVLLDDHSLSDWVVSVFDELTELGYDRRLMILSRTHIEIKIKTMLICFMTSRHHRLPCLSGLVDVLFMNASVSDSIRIAPMTVAMRASFSPVLLGL